ncbi:MAG: hypothetical protein V2I33_16195 [Kangiellaceae bacterium]|jgi:hypothetical protein|nr:hypothetical protein [Kangiellaceae bacterium]
MLVDEEDFPAYLGVKRGATGTAFGNKLTGFIYEFHVYQSAHVDTIDTHASSCTAGCWTDAYNAYPTGQTCANGCDYSCIRTDC